MELGDKVYWWGYSFAPFLTSLFFSLLALEVEGLTCLGIEGGFSVVWGYHCQDPMRWLNPAESLAWAGLCGHMKGRPWVWPPNDPVRLISSLFFPQGKWPLVQELFTDLACVLRHRLVWPAVPRSVKISWSLPPATVLSLKREMVL